MKSWITAAIALAVLAGCSPKAEEAGVDAGVAAPEPAGPQAAVEPGTDGWGKIPFSVDITFSEAAAKKISDMGEKVLVNAMYYGEPKPGVVLSGFGDMGVDLGQEIREIDAVDSKVALEGLHDAPKAAAEVQSGARVLINVFTARKVDENNLLHCDVFDAGLAEAAEKGGKMECKLIEE
jgi:hypothetical protein